MVDGVGVPNLEGNPLPELKGKLQRVFADGNIVLVVDEAGRVFRYDAALHVLDFEPTLYSWRKAWGTGPLTLRSDLKSISYARRSLLNVPVVEDASGRTLLGSNPSSLISFFHENGYSGLSHFYGLSQDGRRLFFADDGLTNSFNYEYDLPAVDDFVGVAVASSGSMVVVLDSKGRFWAKFLDFDWYGSNPMMFDYAYQADASPTADAPPEGFGRVHIPLPSWRELPALPLAPGASTSSELGMVVTGPRNNARELRVRGIDESGSCGLHVIDLEKSAWSFRPTGVCPAAPFVASPQVAPHKRTSTLTGELAFRGTRAHATLSGYSLVDSPVRLELRDPQSGAVTFRGAVHLVPAWSPLPIQDPGRDGRYKLFHGTIEADKGYEASAFASGRNLKSFALTAYGAERELLFKALGGRGGDVLEGRLHDESSAYVGDEVAAHLHRAVKGQGVAAACRELRTRIAADERTMLPLVSTTPVMNVLGLLTGARFWYHHGISMIPPLGRVMEWGTRMLDGRLKLTRYELQLVKQHCGDES